MDKRSVTRGPVRPVLLSEERPAEHLRNALVLLGGVRRELTEAGAPEPSRDVEAAIARIDTALRQLERRPPAA
jgi:hypothetical protein